MYCVCAILEVEYAEYRCMESANRSMESSKYNPSSKLVWDHACQIIKAPKAVLMPRYISMHCVIHSHWTCFDKHKATAVILQVKVYCNKTTALIAVRILQKTYTVKLNCNCCTSLYSNRLCNQKPISADH